MDLTGQLPCSKHGHQYVLNVIDEDINYCEFFPMRTITATAIADVLFKEIICRYGAIRRLLSDHGPPFDNALCRAICDRININKIYSTPYYPKTCGKVERSMYATNLGIYAIARRNRANWSEFVPCVKAAFNSVRSESTNASPHYLMYGWHYEPPLVVSLGIPDAPLAPSWDKYLDEFLQKTKKIREEAYEYSKNYQRKVKQRFDKKARPHQYQNGQLVYLQIPKPRFGYSKTSPKYRGPFSLSEGDSTNFTLHDEKGRY
jgi:hypothetical protein